MKLFIIHLLLFHSAFSAFAITKTSTGNGNWDAADTWSPSGIPAAGDDVVIQNGHTITLRDDRTCLSLSVSGTLNLGNSANDDLTVTGLCTINLGGIVQSGGDGLFFTSGNIINNGTLDLNNGGNNTDIQFNGTANQTLSGSGAITDFNRITINNSGAATNNIVEIMPASFTAVAGFLTLTRGIIKMSGSYTFTNTFFNTAGPTINADEGIWLNNANVTVTGQAGDTELSGLIRITSGIYNVGTGSDWWLFYNSGAVITIEGGALNAASGIFGNLTTSTITYTQSGGTVTVNTAGNTFGVPSFGIEATASVFTMSGGTIVLQRLNDLSTDYINLSTSATVTGGTLQVGNAASPVPTFSYWVNSTPPLYNLVVNTTNTPTCDLRVATTVLNDVTIGGILDVSTVNVNMTVGHDWFNNGTFTRGTATVTFNGTGAQQIAGSVGTTFHNFTVNKSANSLTLNRPTRINGAGTFTAGVVNSTSTNLLTFSDDATTSGANNGSTPSYVNGPVRKEGNDAFTFPVGKTGAGYRFCGISAPGSTGDIFTAEFMRASATALGTIAPGAAPLNHVSNCEYWNIDEGGPGSPTVNVILSWSNLSNCSIISYVNDVATLCIAHFNGTQWDSYGGLGTAVGAPWPTAGTLTWSGVSTFSSFSLGSTSAATNPLPVKFVDVKAVLQNKIVTVEWSNLTEQNVEQYIIERSADGNVFTDMATTNPRTNSGMKESYQVTDLKPLSGTNYYRVKAIEITGKNIYSTIVKVKLNETAVEMVVYPNPVSGRQFSFYIPQLPVGSYNLKLVSISGQMLLSRNLEHIGGSLSQTIDLPGNLSKGIYQILLLGGTHSLSKKILVE